MVLEILLVEDNEAQVHLTQSALEVWKTPFNLHVVTSAEAAIEFLNRQNGYANAPRPHLALIDLNLPKEPGFVVLEAIRQSANLKHTAVMVLSSSIGPAELDRAMPHAAACFKKPVDYPNTIRLFEVLEAFWRMDVRFAMKKGS
jgi:CheY-like chemotaxis protein